MRCKAQARQDQSWVRTEGREGREGWLAESVVLQEVCPHLEKRTAKYGIPGFRLL